MTVLLFLDCVHYALIVRFTDKSNNLCVKWVCKKSATKTTTNGSFEYSFNIIAFAADLSPPFPVAVRVKRVK